MTSSWQCGRRGGTPPPKKNSRLDPYLCHTCTLRICRRDPHCVSNWYYHHTM